MTEFDQEAERAEPDTAWQDNANCLGEDPDLFFPKDNAEIKAAKLICQACAVREECLEYSLETGQKFGIWGGLTERERRRVRRQRALARAGARETVVELPGSIRGSSELAQQEPES